MAGAGNRNVDAVGRRIERLAGLAEPVRRALYRFVAAQREPVTREQAASGVGVAHHVAKFNLDRLVDDGFLEAEYRRPPGRGGPGAGRPAKVYRRAAGEVDVSVPERNYDVAGLLMARAIADSERTGSPVRDALRRVARAYGRALGRDAAPGAGRRSSIAKVERALTATGYEPCVDKDGITLVNCPFDALARDQTELVCGMNVALVEGLVDGAGAEDLTAVLQPIEGQCCVRVRRRNARS